MHTTTKTITIEYSEKTLEEQNLTLKKALNQHGIHIIPDETPYPDGHVYPSPFVRGENKTKEDN